MTYAVIPAAGVGERLRPFTHTKPKPLIFVAGKPIIAHMLDSMVDVVDKVVVIVGYMKEKLIDYLNTHYGSKFSFTFVEQESRLGLGHAVYLGIKDIDHGPILLTLGDEFFGISYADMMQMHMDNGECDASIGVKLVDRPQQYGIVKMDGGIISHLEEKPKNPDSNLAIAGVYIFNDPAPLKSALEEILVENGIDPLTLNPPADELKSEIQLTDALELMVRRNKVLKGFEVPVWYDCGRPEMLLKVNEVLLSRSKGQSQAATFKDSVNVSPSFISRGCKIRNSIIGPNVSVDENTEIINCVIRDSIIGSNVHIENAVLSHSIIGDHVSLVEKVLRVNIGENTQIRLDGDRA